MDDLSALKSDSGRKAALKMVPFWTIPLEISPYFLPLKDCRLRACKNDCSVNVSTLRYIVLYGAGISYDCFDYPLCIRM